NFNRMARVARAPETGRVAPRRLSLPLQRIGSRSAGVTLTGCPNHGAPPASRTVSRVSRPLLSPPQPAASRSAQLVTS
ncbi:hypothetical protein, partial [Burkholderia ubonensis]|uniref:hypothetical protein n=1 Tax=Burkholderia ubonensis TaxID=101571 RepID=UPI001C433709